MREPTPFIHAKFGLPIVLSTGIGGRAGDWSVYMVRPSGSLKRCKQFKEHKSLEEAKRELYEYNGKTLRRTDK